MTMWERMDALEEKMGRLTERVARVEALPRQTEPAIVRAVSAEDVDHYDETGEFPEPLAEERESDGDAEDLPAILLRVSGDVFQANGTTVDGIPWHIYAEAETKKSARSRVSVNNATVARITPAETEAPGGPVHDPETGEVPTLDREPGEEG